MLGDANPKARGFSRTCLDLVTERFPSEGRKIFDSLDASIKKQLSLSEPSTDSNYNKKAMTPKKQKRVIKEESEDEDDFSDESEDEPDGRSDERGSQRSSKVGSMRGMKRKSRPTSKISSGKRRNSRNRTMKPNEKKRPKAKMNSTAKPRVNTRGGKGKSSKNVLASGKGKSKGKNFKRRKGPNKNYYEDAKLEELKDLLHELEDEVSFMC